jgi:hypothetical protein
MKTTLNHLCRGMGRCNESPWREWAKYAVEKVEDLQYQIPLIGVTSLAEPT